MRRSLAPVLLVSACANVLGIQDGQYVGGGGAGGAAGGGGGSAGNGGSGAAGGGGQGGAPSAPHILWAYGIGDAGEDAVYSVTVDASDNTYACARFEGTVDPGTGTVGSNGGTDALLVKLDPFGVPLWSQRFGGSGNDYLGNVVLTPDGRVFLSLYVGSGSGTTIKDVTVGPSEGAMIVARLDPIDGTVIHARKFLSSQDGQPFLLVDGPELILTGNLGGSYDLGDGVTGASQSYDPFLLRLDADLVTIAPPIVFPILPEFQQVYAGATSDDGALVLAGHFSAAVQPPGWATLTGTGTDIFVTTLEGGQATHAASFGGANQESAYAVTASAGRVCLAGAYDSAGISFGGDALPQDGRSAFVACLTPEYDYLASWSLDGPLSRAWGLAAVPGDSSRLLVAGDFQDSVTFGALGDRVSAGSSDGFVAVLDADLSIAWVGVIGGQASDGIGGVAPTSDGFVVCGSFGASTPGVDFGLPSQDTPKNKGLNDGFVVRYAW